MGAPVERRRAQQSLLILASDVAEVAAVDRRLHHLVGELGVVSRAEDALQIGNRRGHRYRARQMLASPENLFAQVGVQRDRRE